MIIKFLLELKEKGWTQQAIADKAGLKQAAISNFYRGKTCTVETLIKIAKTFGVSTDYVLGISPERKKGNNNYHGEERRKPNDRFPPARKQEIETP